MAVATTRDVYAKGPASNYTPKNESIDVVSSEQLEELNYELSGYEDICELVLEGLKINSLADMPKSKFLSSTKRIREIKAARNGQ
jgi:hypothetical protein